MGNKDNLGHGRSPAKERAPKWPPELPPSALVCSAQTISPAPGSGNPPQNALRRASNSKMGRYSPSEQPSTMLKLFGCPHLPHRWKRVTFRPWCGHHHLSCDVGAARHLWSAERRPCTWQGAGIRWPLRSFTTHTFCDSMILSSCCSLLCPWVGLSRAAVNELQV